MLSSEMPDTPIKTENVSRFKKWWSNQTVLTKLIIHQVWMMCLIIGSMYWSLFVCGNRLNYILLHIGFMTIVATQLYAAFSRSVGRSTQIIVLIGDVFALTIIFLACIFSVVSLQNNGPSVERVFAVITLPPACLWMAKQWKPRFDADMKDWEYCSEAKRNPIQLALVSQFILTSIIILCTNGVFDHV